MEVVIEYVLLDNFVIDCVLLFCVNKALHLPINKTGICLASFIGAIFALFSPLLNFGGALMIVVKLSVAFIMVFVATFSFYKLFLRFFCFVLFTFMFGGMLIACCYFLDISVVKGVNLVYFSEIPLGSLIGLGVAFLLCCYGMFKKIYLNARYTKFLFKVSLTINNKTKELNAFFDSGNNLRTKEDVPIVILKEEELKFWFSFEERMQIVCGKFNGIHLKNPQKVEIKSVGAKSLIYVFDADNLRIENRDYAVAVGIDNSNKFKDFSVLLNNRIWEAVC